jgi:adenosylhomocysteine nucleosidase
MPRVAILTPMAREARPLVQALGLRPVAIGGGRAWDGPGGFVAVVGVGPDTAAARTASLLARVQPEQVLVAGVCGALDPALSIGDLVVPELVVDAASGTEWTPHRSALPAAGGVLATVDRLGGPTPAGAVAVDMETAAIAAVCEGAGVPWDVRRAVSDTPGMISPQVAALLRPGGGVDPRALAGLVVRHPGQVQTLLELSRHLKTALTTLREAVVGEFAR